MDTRRPQENEEQDHDLEPGGTVNKGQFIMNVPTSLVRLVSRLLAIARMQESAEFAVISVSVS